MRLTTDLPSSARSLLIADHTRLARLAEDLLISARAGDPPSVCPTWNEFEKGLLAHFDAEESELFPLFEAAHKEEADSLRADHARIRHSLDDVGLSVELHESRVGIIENLLRNLREHAAREENLLYRWTDKKLPPLTRQRLLERLRRGGSAVLARSVPTESGR